LLSSWVDYIESVGNILYAEGISKLGYIEGTSKRIYMEGACSGVYARGKNKVVYVEFSGCRRLVLLIAENRLVYTLSKIGAG
jgi:hypothetical protein